MNNVTYFPNSAQFDLMNTKLDNIAKAIVQGGVVNSFEDTQRAVRAGSASASFPVGSEFTVHHEKFGNLTAVVVAHDYLKSYSDSTAHTMTCMFKEPVYLGEFDAPEAFYCTEASLPVGTYNFTIEQAVGVWSAGTYQFTLSVAVPKNSQLCFNVKNNVTLVNAEVEVYQRYTFNLLTTARITSGSAGTSLGSPRNGLNDFFRVANGSNNYRESAIRIRMNGANNPSTGWYPESKYDRPPTWYDDKVTFPMGFENDFLGIVGGVSLPCVPNDVYEVNSTTPISTSYTLTDRFYLPSYKEIFGESLSEADQSQLLPFFDGATSADRYAYSKDGMASAYMTRTPKVSDAHRTMSVSMGGIEEYALPSTSLGARIMFTIV